MRSAMMMLAMCCLGLTAWGQEPAAIGKVRSDVHFHQAAEHAFLEYEASLTTHCAEIQPDWSRATHISYVTPVVDAKGDLVTAAWSEMVPGMACGQPRRFRTLVIVREGKAEARASLPGESNASALLVKDARTSVVAGVATRHPADKCPMDILDTTLVGGVAPKPHETWNEVWLVSVCGHRMRVPITFIPDKVGEGTSFGISSSRIVDVP